MKALGSLTYGKSLSSSKCNLVYHAEVSIRKGKNEKDNSPKLVIVFKNMKFSNYNSCGVIMCVKLLASHNHLKTLQLMPIKTIGKGSLINLLTVTGICICPNKISMECH